MAALRSFSAFVLSICLVFGGFSIAHAVEVESSPADKTSVEPAKTEEFASLSVRSVTTLLELQQAVADYQTSASDMTIQVTKTFEIDSVVTISANQSGKTLTLESADANNPITLTRSSSFNDDLVVLQSKAQVVLESIGFDGNKDNIAADLAQGSLVRVNDDAELTILDGTTLKNNRGDTSGGAIWSSGILTIHGGVIAGNEFSQEGDTYGGGVYVEGTKPTTRFFFDGGMIGGYAEKDANKALSGGGICIMGDPKDTRKDAYVITGDAKIIGNIAAWDPTEGLRQSFGKGGGVFHQSGTLLISGGAISRNVAKGKTSSGGGINNYDGTLLLTGGIIGGSTPEEGNVAGKGGGLCNESQTNDAILISGNTQIINNIAGREVNGVVNDGLGGGIAMAGDTTIHWSSGTIAHNRVRGLTEFGNMGSGIYLFTGTTLSLSGSPVMNDSSLYSEEAFSDCIVLASNLSKASILVEGSLVENQMAIGTVVAKTLPSDAQDYTSMASFTVDDTTASAFHSIDGTLLGAAKEDTVVWASSTPKPTPTPTPTPDPSPSPTPIPLAGDTTPLQGFFLIALASLVVLAIRRIHNKYAHGK